jgi:peptidoglycan/LPS O-acetylase OafA/YrhL
MGIIRLLLALSVVAAHCGPIFNQNFVNAPIAVQSFYIISGFYMSLILNEKYIGANSSYKLFITNRLLRLYPIYWIVLIGTIITGVGIIMVTKGHMHYRFDSYLQVKANFLTYSYLFVTNIFIFGQDVVMFLGIRPENGTLFYTSNFHHTSPTLESFLFVPQAWTLGIELTFYLIAPFLLRRGFKIILPLIVESFLLRLFIYDYLGLQNDPWTYRFFPTEVMFFLLGYVSFRVYAKIKTSTLPKYLNECILLIAVFSTICYPYLPAYKAQFMPFSTKEIIYFFTIILSIPFLFNFLKRSKLDTQVGDLSYPVYISHMLIFTFCTAQPFAFFKSGWMIALITIIAAILLNKLIGAPLEKYRQARLAK